MATGVAEHIDATTADVFIKEVWSQAALVATEDELVFAMLSNRQFESDAAHGDTIHVPSLGNLSVQTKNRSDNAATIFETITESNTDITIATWIYSAIALETATKKQVNRDLLKAYAPKQGFAIGQKIDDDLAALVDDFTQTVGALITENTYDEVLRARQYLNDANAPRKDRSLVISPAAETGFMKLQEFIHSDFSKLQGEINDGVRNAYVGTWMRLPVYVSTNVEGSNAAGHDNAMFQKQAIALVQQMTPTTHIDFDINYMADKVVVESLYGVKEMRDDHGVWIKGA